MENSSFQAQKVKLQESLCEDGRKVYDSVYGFIVLPKLVWQFVDSPHFQRLRDIKQLGCLSWVFPGSMHSRFEHCLGTGYLAQKYIQTLIKKHRQNPHLTRQVYRQYFEMNTKQNELVSIEKQAVFTVTLAGILHDLGHGPYSHLFDLKVIEQIPYPDLKNEKNQPVLKKWTHELAGLKLIDSLFNKVANKKGKYERSWLLNRVKPRVQTLIVGKQQKGCEQYFDELATQLNYRPWQFEIISNRITGIDVDKLDYFRRDAHYLGAKNIYIDHELLMKQSLILHDQSCKDKDKQYRICYPSKYSEKVYDVYFSRYKLYKTYYLNLKSNGVDAMIGQILNLACDQLQLKQACIELVFSTEDKSQSKYLRLTDQILERIQNRYDQLSSKITQQQKKGQSYIKFCKAVEILDKLKNREIYDFLREYHTSFSGSQLGNFKSIQERIKKYANNINKTKQEVVISVSRLGFGITDYDPLGELKFFEKSSKDKKISDNKDKYHYSMLRPDRIVEISVRIYYKKRVRDANQDQIKHITQLLDEISKGLYQESYKTLVLGNEGTFMSRGSNIEKKDLDLERERVNVQQMEGIQQHF